MTADTTRTRTERGATGGVPTGPETAVAKRKGLSETGLARVFLAPSVITMALVALFPVIYAAIISFYLYIGRTQTGVGLENYVQAVTSSRFWDALIATFLFTVVSVGFEFLIGLGFALIMNQAFLGRGVTRATILIPGSSPR